MPVSIAVIPVLGDNYAFIIHDGSSAAVIDPGEAGPIARFVAEHKLHLSIILVTHHHGDHCGGVAALKQSTGAQFMAPADPRIARVDEPIKEDQSPVIISTRMETIATPGHTRTHLVYYFPALCALFTGDTLFSAGCGRLFEGSPVEMVGSLARCAALPDDTAIYGGHEYTEENLRFALSVDPENRAIHERLDIVNDLRRRGRPSVPSTLAIEKATNPFLRCADKAIRTGLHMQNATNIEVFAQLRRMKDRF
jgi:hydroxyacylglutathione hydrolase